MYKIQTDQYSMLNSKLEHGKGWRQKAVDRIVSFAQKLEDEKQLYKIRANVNDHKPLFIEFSRTAFNILFPEEQKHIRSIDYNDITFFYTPTMGLRQFTLELNNTNDNLLKTLINPKIQDNHVHIHDNKAFFDFMLVD